MKATDDPVPQASRPLPSGPPADTAPEAARKVAIGIRLRRYHRWASTGAMVVLAWVSGTGAGLGIDIWLSGRVRLEHKAATGPMPRAQIGAWVESALRLASPAGAHPFDNAQLALWMTASGPRATVTIQQDKVTPRQVIEIDPVAGRILSSKMVPVEAPKPAWRVQLHHLLKDMHRGSIIGLPGRLLSLIAGLSFIFLAGSGLWLFIDIWLKRRRSGRPGLFWSR